MKSGISEIVHIIPLGHEFDRAVRPFDTAAANHVYLITDSGDAGEGAENLPPKREYVSRVIRYLKKKHIPADVVETDFSDMGELLKTIASLIRKEQFFGNKVYVNMSAAGELGAAAATLAGMALNAEVYCVHADGYASDAERAETGVSVCRTNAVSILPKVDIHLPDDAELPVLEELYYADNNVLSASEISEVVENEPDSVDTADECFCNIKLCEPVFIGHRCPETPAHLLMSDKELEAERSKRRKVQSRNLMKVSGMMKRMEEKGYVTNGKFGRKMLYQLTERGMYALILSGYVDN